MASHILVDKVQQWLSSTKLKADDVDVDLEVSASDYVLGRLSALYVTTAWLTDTTTPSLVQDIISMFVAAWIYRRSYAEVTTDGATEFPVWLEARAEMMINGILTGSITLPGSTSTATEQPLYLPTEFTGTTQQYDAAGNLVGVDEFSEDIKFRMGTRY